MKKIVYFVIYVNFLEKYLNTSNGHLCISNYLKQFYMYLYITAAGSNCVRLKKKKKTEHKSPVSGILTFSPENVFFFVLSIILENFIIVFIV